MEYTIKYILPDKKLVYKATPDGQSQLTGIQLCSSEKLEYAIYLTRTPFAGPDSLEFIPKTNQSCNKYFNKDGLCGDPDYLQYIIDIKPQKPSPGVFAWQFIVFQVHFDKLRLAKEEESKVLKATISSVPEFVTKYKPSIASVCEWTLTADFSGSTGVYSISSDGDRPKKILKKNLAKYFGVIPREYIHEELLRCANGMGYNTCNNVIVQVFKNLNKHPNYLDLCEDGFCLIFNLFVDSGFDARHMPHKFLGLDKALYDCIKNHKLQNISNTIKYIKNVSPELVNKVIEFFPRESITDIGRRGPSTMSYHNIFSALVSVEPDLYDAIIWYAKKCESRGVSASDFGEKLCQLRDIAGKSPDLDLGELLALESASTDVLAVCESSSKHYYDVLPYSLHARVNGFTVRSPENYMDVVLGAIQFNFFPTVSEFYHIFFVEDEGGNRVGAILTDPNTTFTYTYGVVPKPLDIDLP